VAKRKKSDLPSLSDWRAVDRTIRIIADEEACAARWKAEAEEKIRRIREDTAACTAEVLTTAQNLRDAIEAFAGAHEGDFGKARSKALPHGRVGWRTVASVRLLRSSEFVVAALESAGLSDAVIVRKSPNKDVLAAYPDETLREVGCRRKSEDKFYIEPAEETPAGA